jgi:hypothetical protein
LKLEAVADETNLSDFFQTIFDGQEGLVYLAFKRYLPSGNPKWEREWYEWPGKLDEIINSCQEKSSRGEVYFGPSLYVSKSSQKKDIIGSSVVWAEIDGNIPETLDGIPEPTIRVSSSEGTGHEHWYWKLDNVLEVPALEDINRRIAIAISADISGWDSTQVLRPPNTYNHKRGRNVSLLRNSKQEYSADVFRSLPDPPRLPEVTFDNEIPSIEDVIAKYKFPGNVWYLFRNGVPVGSRSDGLMTLGYFLAEMQLRDGEVFALLHNADERWGKFKGRDDQKQRLAQIVSIARAKFPLLDIEPTDRFKSYGFQELLKTDVHLEWVWNGMLQKEGFFLLTGPPGIGKTQFSLDFAQRIALGQDFLERSVPGSLRIGFLELEMGLVDTKFFLEHQSKAFTNEELERLETNLKILPLGEPLYLSKQREQDVVEDWIHQEKLDGIIIDSLGSTCDELSDETSIKRIIDFNARIRQRHSIFTWWVHHHRKASGDNKRPNKLDDVYGSRYITASATTVYCLWPGSDESSIQGIPLKMRLSAKPPVGNIYRDAKLHFTQMANQSAIQVVKKKSEKTEKGSGLADSI